MRPLDDFAEAASPRSSRRPSKKAAVLVVRRGRFSTVAVFHPAQRIPKNLKRVWENPPTYANLDDRFHDSGPLQSWDFRPQNTGIPTARYDSNFGNARLVVVRCRLIVPDHYVMTDAGLKRVVSVER